MIDLQKISNNSNNTTILCSGLGPKEQSRVGLEYVMYDLSISWELETFGHPEKYRNANTDKMFTLHPDKIDEILFRIPKECERFGCKPRIVRLPSLLSDTKRDDLDELLFDLNKEALGFAGRIGAKYAIVSCVYRPGGATYDHDATISLLQKLAAIAEESGVTLLLENSLRMHNGQYIRGFCSDGRDAAKLIDELGLPIGLCFNTGNANLCGMNMQSYIENLGDRIKVVLLRDCDGDNRASLMPYTAVRGGVHQTNWLQLVRGLRSIGYHGDLVVDGVDTLMAFPPDIREGLLRVEKEIGQWFAWQIGIEEWMDKYDSRVLFGAGNMCRNYMNSYGKKYPPLFTCDNDKNIWGTEFCGLEVRSPEALREISKESVIILCNLYYEEITKQIRDMGITNPIEYFHDYYMPELLPDRIEREWDN